MGGDGESVALMWVMVSRVGTYPQTHGSVYVNYVQLFTCHHTSIKWLIKKKKKPIFLAESFGMEQNLLIHSATIF